MTTANLIIGFLFMLAGLFGMISWVRPNWNPQVSWVLVFVAGLVWLVQGRL